MLADFIELQAAPKRPGAYGQRLCSHSGIQGVTITRHIQALAQDIEALMDTAVLAEHAVDAIAFTLVIALIAGYHVYLRALTRCNPCLLYI